MYGALGPYRCKSFLPLAASGGPAMRATRNISRPVLLNKRFACASAAATSSAASCGTAKVLLSTTRCQARRRVSLRHTRPTSSCRSYCSLRSRSVSLRCECERHTDAVACDSCARSHFFLHSIISPLCITRNYALRVILRVILRVLRTPEFHYGVI